MAKAREIKEPNQNSSPLLSSIGAGGVAALYEAMQKLLSADSIDTILEVIIGEAIKLCGAETGFIATVHTETHEFKVLVKRGGELTNASNLFSKSNQTLEKILSQTGASLVLGNTPENPLFFERSQAMVAQAFHLLTADAYIVVIEHSAKTGLSEKSRLLFGEYLRGAIEILKRRSKFEESDQENILLWDMKSRLREAMDNFDETNLPILLSRILELALSRTHTKRGGIMLLDEETGDLITESQAVKGELISSLPKRLLRRKSDRASGIVFRVIDTNRPYLANDVDKDPHYVPLFVGILSTLAVPIPFQNRAIGVIVVESRRRNAFTLEDQRVLVELSRSISMFVRRAQLYIKTRSEGEAGIMIRGLSPEWEEVERRVEKAAATDATVLLRGESGTGKELVAHSIHFNSPRAKKPFIVVNCAAIPNELLESELFGHKKGAFTGAAYDHTGKIELADEGTLFLDEIGDLSLPLQVKLLRFLQNGEIQKIGSETPPKKVNVRLLAATSRNLEQMMKENRFREDLYYRLHVVPISMPPLRSYRQSISGMAEAFIQDANVKYNKKIKGISDSALAILMQHDYPGNVRELKNIIERAVILCDNDTLDVGDLPEELNSQVKKEDLSTSETSGIGWNYKSRKKSLLRAFDVKYLTELLSRTKGNVREASEIAGLKREQLYPMLKRAGIDPEMFRK